MNTKLIKLQALNGMLEGGIITVPSHTREWIVPYINFQSIHQYKPEDVVRTLSVKFISFGKFERYQEHLVEISEMVIPE
jgi:hypothetical protein